MSDATPPPVAEGTVRSAPQALTPEQIDIVLADFRGWLEKLASSSTTPDLVQIQAPPAQPVDLSTLLGQFVALRHEVNLQTKASRMQQEQNAETLHTLEQALVELEKSQVAASAREETPKEEILRPLLKTLVDLYDALSLAHREIQRVREAMLPDLEQLKKNLSELTLSSPPTEPRRNFWNRVFGRKSVSSVQSQIEDGEQRHREFLGKMEQSAGRVQHFLSSLLTGYTMSLQRIERALQQYDLDPIPANGEPFDPERMEVVAVVLEPGRDTTVVIEEVRRGYMWQGRVFRYAQVRVAKPEVNGNGP